MSERFGEFLRRHWFDCGLGIAALLLFLLFVNQAHLHPLQGLAISHFIALLAHQFEEYRWPGYFPGFVNRAMYKSDRPDRYPLNTQSALVINVYLGWMAYVAGVIFYESIWLNIALSLVSAGNILAHTFLFNIKGKTYYNPGMATSLVFFLPIVVYYWNYILSHDLAKPVDLVVGITVGVVLNAAILLMIARMKDMHTAYVFEARQVTGR